jgi:hypothetical protein
MFSDNATFKYNTTCLICNEILESDLRFELLYFIGKHRHKDGEENFELIEMKCNNCENYSWQSKRKITNNLEISLRISDIVKLNIENYCDHHCKVRIFLLIFFIN